MADDEGGQNTNEAGDEEAEQVRHWNPRKK